MATRKKVVAPSDTFRGQNLMTGGMLNGLFGTQQGKDGDNYGSILAQFLGNQGTDLTGLLSSLGVGELGKFSDSQVEDWNQMLLKQIIQYLVTAENRQYNEQMLQEGRTYDSPINQLTRLTSAGIGRDQALQLLSGAAGGSGAAMPYSQPAAGVQSPAASESYLNEIQGKTAIANTVFGGLSCLNGFLQLGFSVPQAIAQTTAMQMQNFVSQQALLGLQYSDAIMSSLSSAVQTGAISQETLDGFSGANDALNYIADHQDTTAFKDIFNSDAYKYVRGTQNGAEMFNRTWHAQRDSRDYGKQLDAYIKSLNLDNDLKTLNLDQVKGTIANLSKTGELMDAQITEILQRNHESAARVLYMDKQGKWVDAQAHHQENVNEVSDASLSYVKDIQVRQLQLTLDKLKALDRLSDSKNGELGASYRDEIIESFCKDASNAYFLSDLKSIYLNSNTEFSTQHPDFFKWLSIIDMFGIFDKVKTAAGVGMDIAGIIL